MDRQEEDRLWKAISKQQESLNRIETGFARVEQKLDSHMADPSIHTRPPCEHYKVLTGRVWALFVGVVTSLIGAAGAIISAIR